ncbi:MAG: glycosyltransferase [Armatimonadetes bacterium]|nr:glycosyltransferase [Armatimonadota bacterium]
MKILIVQPVGHTVGHHSYYTRRLSESLLDTGEVRQVTVVTHAGFWDQWPERDGLTLVQAADQQVTSWAPCERPHLWAEATRSALRTALPLVGGHDVVQVLDAWYRTLAWSLWRRRDVMRKSVVLWHHLPTGAVIPPLRALPRGLRTRLRLTLPVLVPERILLSNTTSLVHAETVADGIHRWLPRARVAVIPPGSDLHTGRLPDRTEARRALGLDIGDAFALLIFGYLGEHKGIHTLLEALNAGAPPDLRILIAGPPAAGVDIEGMVARSGWAPRTVLHAGYVPDDQVLLWFRAADAVLLAYPAHFVQNSGVLTRAADFRVPVVCSDVGQMGRFVRDYGLGTLFAPEDPASMRAAIDEMLAANGQRRGEMIAGLARYAEDHSWPRIARRHVELYRSVMDG